MFPSRFKTGCIGKGVKKSIANPYHMYAGGDDADVFQGDVKDYDFRKQKENFDKLQKVLKDNGTELGPIVAALFDGDGGYSNNYKHMRQHRFVSCSVDGSLMWEKYAAQSATGNQNDVYVGGKHMHLAHFLGIDDSQQRALLGGNPSMIALAFA
jgi:hypothetical protein